MNIKKDLYNDGDLMSNLLASSLFTIEIGSRMYGLTHKDSDTDYLHIYNTSEKELNQISQSEHQIQFKGDNTDFLFVNIHTFLRNIITGDSTINFEVLHSKDLIDTVLEFLYDSRKYFHNYKIVRSYLGMARRDLKRIDKDGKTEFGKNKKIAHAYRGLLTARKIINGAEDIFLDKDEINHIKTVIWGLKGYTERSEYSKILMEEINKEREQLNKSKMVSLMLPKHQRILNDELFKFLKETKISKMRDFDLGEFYDANENGVKY